MFHKRGILRERPRAKNLCLGGPDLQPPLYNQLRRVMVCFRPATHNLTPKGDQMTTNPLIPGVNGLPKVVVPNPDSTQAEVYLHGAHVTSWIPAGDEEQLYLSTASEFRDGAAIRGGVPVVFPQFSTWGPLPKHGFARDQAWKLVGVSPGSTRFQLRDSESTHAI